MKRYENMSKEEILDFFITCFAKDCKYCPAYPPSHGGTTPCAFTYLNKEVPMVPRYQNLHCKQDWVNVIESMSQSCGEDCSDCKYDSFQQCTTYRFIDYLWELEPKREKE